MRASREGQFIAHVLAEVLLYFGTRLVSTKNLILPFSHLPVELGFVSKCGNLPNGAQFRFTFSGL